MSYLRLALVVLLALSAQFSRADTFKTFQITQVIMYMAQNNGEGDNVSFYFSGPGVLIEGSGGMPCWDWCSSAGTTDLSNVNMTQIFVDSFAYAFIGGKGYDPEMLVMSNPFTDNGDVAGFATGSVGSDTEFFQFNLILPTNGSWNLQFMGVQGQDGAPDYFVFTLGELTAERAITPEPGTLGLTLMGLTCIAGILKRRLVIRR
jgi:hypothetical protein